MSLARCTVAMSLLFDDTNHPRIGNKEGIDQWPFQKPKLEVPTVYGLYEANVREYPNKIWPYMVQYLHFRILKFPLNWGVQSCSPLTPLLDAWTDFKHINVFTQLCMCTYIYTYMHHISKSTKKIILKKQHAPCMVYVFRFGWYLGWMSVKHTIIYHTWWSKSTYIYIYMYSNIVLL